MMDHIKRVSQDVDALILISRASKERNACLLLHISHVAIQYGAFCLFICELVEFGAKPLLPRIDLALTRSEIG